MKGIRTKGTHHVDYEDEDDIFISMSMDMNEHVISREPVARLRQKFPETWLWIGNTTGYLNSAFPFHPA